MLITITDFADERHTDRDTINAYIRKHPEIKQFIVREGKNSVVDTDSIAYELLDKQYPLPQLIQVVEDTESRNKLIKAQELIIQLQKQLQSQSTLIAQAEAQKMLLEDKEEQLHEIKTEKAVVDQELNDVKEELSDTKSELGKFKKTFLGFYKKIE